jgi:hypothetical protein
MGTGTPDSNITEVEEKCRICLQQPEPDCAWRQGRCPHCMSMLDQIITDPYQARFYNLIQSIKKFL